MFAFHHHGLWDHVPQGGRGLYTSPAGGMSSITR
jgi:hypothetical protein